MNTRTAAGILIVTAILLFQPGFAVSKAKKSTDTVVSKYWLPYPGGVSHPINQGFHGRWTHHDGNQNEYAIDFGGRVGNVLCAAREGTVIRVTDSDQTDDGNTIMIQHEDDEVSVYAHNSLGSVKVAEGDEVVAGQEICQMGKLLHLHFAVWLKYRGIPMGFKDVNERNGEPTEFKVYKSKNYVDKRRAGIIDPEELAKANLNKLLTNARKYMKKKKYSYARKYYDRALQHPNTNDKVKKEVGEAYGRIEDDAKKAFAEAKKLLENGNGSKSKKVLFKMMRYYKGTSVFEDARKLLRTIKAESFEKKIIHTPEKLLELVDELIKDGRYNKVFFLLDSLAQNDNEVGKKAKKIKKDLLDSKEFMKKVEEARADDEVRLIFERVDNLLRYHQYDDAISQLERLIKLYPNTKAAKKAKDKIEEIEEIR
ncbi:MAG: M23 family metallopeptidase [Planctomycetota bacterium]|jgi:hypothetical protein